MNTLQIQNQPLFFDFNFSSLKIARRRVILQIDFVINLFLYLAVFTGFLSLAFYLYQKITVERTPLPLGLFEIYFWQVTTIYLKIFFVSVFLGLFLIYRQERQKESKQVVVKKTAESPQTAKQLNITNAFSPSALLVIEQSYLFAEQNHYQEVTPLHLLVALLQQSQSGIILWRLGVNIGALTGKIKRGLEGLLLQQSQNQNAKHSLCFSSALKKIILESYSEVWQKGGGRQVEVLDMWVPLVEEEGYAREILYDLEIETDKVRNVIAWLQVEDSLRKMRAKRGALSGFKSKHGMDRAMTAVQTRFLNAFSQDLTVLARNGYLIPSLGHQKQIEDIFHILEGGARAVLLVGNPGTGKQSLVEEIAQRMAAELIPEILQDKRLLSLSVAGVLAGGSESGAGERLYRALDEAAHSGNVVLFIKDIHNIVGVSVSGGKAGGVGIEQILAQGLENSHFLVIGTSDYRNYPRYIENSALQSVLVKIDIPEPDFNETILMLESRVPFVEGQQNVFFTYQSLEKAVELTNKLIHTEYQPEKSLKILQETASRVRALRGKKAVVTENDIAEVISAKVNMPLTKIQKTEQDKLLNLEKEIHLKFINQELAVKEVAEALRRARAELRDERRPIANFLFVGPTGVGKTELVKRLATIYFNSEKDIIRLDMSEFQEVSSIERLLGSANSPGLLTQPVKESPFGILLLDELEKAHPNIFNLFLQVMDDGRLTSGAGEVIDFTNLIIVMTSNAGTKILQDRLSQGKTIEEIKEEFVKKDLLEFFRPEFLNRFDAVIVFKPLTQENIEQIAGLILADLAGRLEKKGIALKWTEEAMKELAHLGFDPLYGARPLRRAIQEHVQNVLANYLLSGAIGRRDVVYLEPGGKIRVEKAVEL